MSVLSCDAVVIGASAGGLSALSVIFSALPVTYNRPILVVLHLPPDKKNVAAEVLKSKCALKIKEAEDKEAIQPGIIYFAPPDYHLLVEMNKTLSLSTEEPVLFSRPSIDVLFETAADAYGPGLVGVILSGANSDGSQGLKLIIDAGGRGVVQDPVGSYAKAMPEAALALCPNALTMGLEEISKFIQEGVQL